MSSPFQVNDGVTEFIGIGLAQQKIQQAVLATYFLPLKFITSPAFR
jgi:hypothetical protein